MNHVLKFAIISIIVYSLAYGALMSIINEYSLGNLLSYVFFGVLMTGFELFQTKHLLKKIGVNSLKKDTLDSSVSRIVHSEESLTEIYSKLNASSLLKTKKKFLKADRIEIVTTSLLGNIKPLVLIRKKEGNQLQIIANDLDEHKDIWFRDYLQLNQLINKIETILQSSKQQLI